MLTSDINTARESERAKFSRLILLSYFRPSQRRGDPRLERPIWRRQCYHLVLEMITQDSRVFVCLTTPCHAMPFHSMLCYARRSEEKRRLPSIDIST